MTYQEPSKPAGNMIIKNSAAQVDIFSIIVPNFKLRMLIRLAINIGGNCEKKSFNVPFMNNLLPI